MSIFSRLEKQRSSDVDPHQWDLSSREHVKKFGISSKHPKTAIPDPLVFRDAIVPSLRGRESGLQTTYPNPGHLAAHLSLVECFLKFKKSVLTSDELDILDVPVYPGSADRASSRLSVSSSGMQRWDTILHLAVARFQIWFENIESILRHAAAYHRFGPDSNASHAAITKDYLPPLDVLLVWYAYMQNPGSYQQDLRSHESGKLLEIPLPWEAILAVINLESLTYEIPSAAQKLFTTTTTQSADILVYLTHPPPYTNLEPEKAFSVDLASAVHKLVDASLFMESAHSLLWLRSPALEGTLLRALARYGALARVTENTANNWLDRVENDPPLELVWRTHMLYPTAYEEYCSSIFGSDVTLQGGVSTQLSDFGDVKNPNGPTQTSEASVFSIDDDSINTADICYCWTCERIRDEDPNYAASTNPDQHPSMTANHLLPQYTTSAPRGFSRLRSPSQASSSAPELPANPLAELTKEQIASIKADVAFYRYVEEYRQSNPSGATLPTRAATARDTEKSRLEKEAKDRAGTYYGMGYTVEVVRPAIYDPATGRLLKKEKTKVKRSKHMAATGIWGTRFAFL